MPDKDLVRRALMGDQEAQKECTEKGIVLPCPCCGRSMEMVSNGFAHTNTKCILNLRYFKFTDTELISLWNTRPAPPVGRCGECALWKEEKECPGSFCCTITGMERESNDFCSEFEPREE